MIEAINKYVLMAPFHNKDAGFSKWTLAKKGGKEYFIKEFLDPVYPTDTSISDEFLRSSIQNCRQYEEKKKRLYSAVNRASDGNIARIEELFRCDNHYYLVTERISGPKMTPQELQNHSYQDRLLLCKTVAHAMMKVHDEGIIHADIKPSNIMLSKSASGRLVGKIIDFDSSFFRDDPPRHSDDLVGDQVYMSPEACLFICGEPAELTCKMDVFGLGILFHQYLTGTLPSFDTREYDYAFDYVLDGYKLGVSTEIPSEIRAVISSMLEQNPDNRPTMRDVYNSLGLVGAAAAASSFRTDAPASDYRREIKEEKEPVKKTMRPEDYFKAVKD